jgi:N-acetylglucosamine kinase-like BadF-type ATPase
MGDLLLGVDGGGTKTEAMFADLQGNVLSRGLGPASNLQWVGFENMTQSLRVAIETAARDLPAAASAGATSGGLLEGRIAAACFGLAGVNNPPDQARLIDWLRSEGVAERFSVLNDSELILAGGTPDGWGVALISGTGSVCLGRTAEGRTARAGGWGPLFGDEGSGYEVGLHALRLATQTADGRAAATALCDAVLAHLKLGKPEDLIEYAYHTQVTPTDIAALALVVFDLAGQGDTAAKAMVGDAASSLARLVEAVVRRLDMHAPPLALGGGALRGILREAVLERLEVEVGPVTLVSDPVRGAVTIARRLLTSAVS